MKSAADIPRIGNLALVCVDPAQVEKFWPMVRELIRSAIEEGGGDDTIYNVLDALVSKRSLLWLVWDDLGKTVLAAGTTTLISTARGKVCILANCSGHSMKLWLRFIDPLEAYARTEGCRLTRIYGREGWQRVLPGYTKAWVTLEKTL